jgi:hypothetical protein
MISGFYPKTMQIKYKGINFDVLWMLSWGNIIGEFQKTTLNHPMIKCTCKVID